MSFRGVRLVLGGAMTTWREGDGDAGEVVFNQFAIVLLHSVGHGVDPLHGICRTDPFWL